MEGEPGLVRREGRAGFGLVGETEGELDTVRPVLKGLLETSFCCSSGFSGEA